ncbi:putative oxidoreductase [Nymphon striatum]|nr:putative oxidoreductase [Nymphon striatum]
MSDKKTIVITGASSGIGSAIALRMANPESRLILLARNQQKLDEISARLYTTICRRVTNCVGRKGEAETWDEITQVIDTNLNGVLASLNPLISRMQTRKQGHIAIISSLAAFYGMPITPSYCASKAAVKRLWRIDTRLVASR